MGKEPPVGDPSWEPTNHLRVRRSVASDPPAAAPMRILEQMWVHSHGRSDWFLIPYEANP